MAFGRSGQKSSSPSPKKSNSKTSLGHTSLSVEDNGSYNSSNVSSPFCSKQNSIGSYDVDFEKLARELILPSLNEPLTSFKDGNANSTKPILQTYKTVDISDVTKKPKFARANTGNQ